MPNRLSKIVNNKPSAKKTATKKQKPVSVKIVSDNPKVDEKWRAQSDLRTLQEAEQIRRDGSRYRAAKSEGKSMIKDLAKVVK